MTHQGETYSQYHRRTGELHATRSICIAANVYGGTYPAGVRVKSQSPPPFFSLEPKMGGGGTKAMLEECDNVKNDVTFVLLVPKRYPT